MKPNTHSKHLDVREPSKQEMLETIDSVRNNVVLSRDSKSISIRHTEPLPPRFPRTITRSNNRDITGHHLFDYVEHRVNANSLVRHF